MSEEEIERVFLIKEGVMGATSQCLPKPFAADLQACTAVAQSSYRCRCLIISARVTCTQVIQSDVSLNDYLIPV